MQYRHKSTSKRIFLENSYKIKKHLDPNKLLIINDHVDIALAIGNGVHIGQDDFPLEHIRKIVPDNFIVGISCHSFAEAKLAAQHDVSYIAIGCLFKTASKNNVLPVSIAELRKVCREISVPICAIGGINNHNLDQIIPAQISMAALISYVWTSANPLKTICEMHHKIADNI